VGKRLGRPYRDLKPDGESSAGQATEVDLLCAMPGSRAQERAKVPPPIHISNQRNQPERPPALSETPGESGKDLAAPKRNGAQQIQVLLPEADERDAPVLRRSEHRVRAALERIESRRETLRRRSDVSADDDCLAAEGRDPPRGLLQTLPERAAPLREPNRLAVRGESSPPSGAVLGRCGDDQTRPGEARRLPPAFGEGSEKLRRLPAGKPLLARLPLGRPREEDKITAHPFHLTTIGAAADSTHETFNTARTARVPARMKKALGQKAFGPLEPARTRRFRCSDQ